MNGKTLTFVACGGAAGAVCRYILLAVINNEPFASATLAANIAGSFLLLLFTALITGKIIPAGLKPLVGAGFCGGFTTMSTFAGELYRYAETFSISLIVSYLSFSIIGGLAAGLAGWFLGMFIIQQVEKGRGK